MYIYIYLYNCFFLIIIISFKYNTILISIYLYIYNRFNYSKLYLKYIKSQKIYPPTPTLAKAGTAPETIEGVEPKLSKSFLFWARNEMRKNLTIARLWAQLPDGGLWALARQILSNGSKLPFKPLKSPEICQWFCNTGSWNSQLLHSRRVRRSKISHLLDCGLWALCQIVASGAPNPFL